MKNRLSSQFNLKIGSGIISKSVIDIIPKWRTTGAKLAHIQDNAMVLHHFGINSITIYYFYFNLLRLWLKQDSWFIILTE